MKFYEFDETNKKVDIFNERWYPRKLGKEIKYYRNVTTILGIIDKGYNFQEWLKNVGHNSEIIIDRAGRFGTDFHKMVELFFKEQNISYFDIVGDEVYKTALWERFNIWLEFYKELRPVPVASEFIVYSDKYEYAGTADFITKTELYDWKTGNQIGNQEKLQMVAYMRAYQEMTGIKLTKANLVHIPKDKPNKKGYRITEVENSDALFEYFLATKKVFDMMNSDTPKIVTLPLQLNIKDY